MYGLFLGLKHLPFQKGKQKILTGQIKRKFSGEKGRKKIKIKVKKGSLLLISVLSYTVYKFILRNRANGK